MKDREAWCAAVFMGLQSVGHDLATKQKQRNSWNNAELESNLKELKIRVTERSLGRL